MRNSQIPYQGLNNPQTRIGCECWPWDYLGTELLHLATHKSLINLHLHGRHTDFSLPCSSLSPSSGGCYLPPSKIGKSEMGSINSTRQQRFTFFPSFTAGLDPALPLYDFQSKNQRLCPSDAAFVDVIHTDGGVLGLPFPMGHADFFPNGGKGLQPGCVEQQIQKQQWLGVFSE